MQKRKIITILAFVWLSLVIAIVMKPQWQKTWMYMTGAVSPYRSATCRYAEHHNLLLSVGGNRWVSGDKQEEAMAYHALVIPPQVELREDGSASSSDGIDDTEVLDWLCPRESGGSYQAAETQSLTITYHGLSREVIIGDDTFRLTKGNLFVVRLDEQWRPHATQFETTIDKAEFDDVIKFFKRVLPDDEAVKKL